jgi:protein SCO1/2
MKRSFFKCLFASSVLLFISAVYAESKVVKQLDKPVLIDNFELFDQGGNSFTEKNLLGSWSLIFLGFTTCPDICPMTMAQLEGVRAELGSHFTPEKIPNIIFVAVDPARDKDVLADYLAYFHPKNIGITGELSQIDRLVESVDGFYRFDKNKRDSGYTVVHTSSIAVVNPQGEMVANINPPFGKSNTAWELMLLMRGRAIE